MRIATYRRTGSPGGELALSWQDRTLATFISNHPGWHRVLDVADIALPFAHRIADDSGLGQVLAAAKAGRIDAVVVTHLDRIARDTGQLDVVVRRLRAAGVDLLAAPDDIPVSGALLRQQAAARALLDRLGVPARVVSAR